VFQKLLLGQPRTRSVWYVRRSVHHNQCLDAIWPRPRQCDSWNATWNSQGLPARTQRGKAAPERRFESKAAAGLRGATAGNRGMPKKCRRPPWRSSLVVRCTGQSIRRLQDRQLAGSCPRLRRGAVGGEKFGSHNDCYVAFNRKGVSVTGPIVEAINATLSQPDAVPSHHPPHLRPPPAALLVGSSTARRQKRSHQRQGKLGARTRRAARSSHRCRRACCSSLQSRKRS